ncbi:hypothetical protein KP509_07G078900 [Ceratopteris richardii]|uniref:Secreted protein n=1 Tax=Ceratopteris richardii TaxID=49495 RepID=A0A8T2UII3_CERRI|nr:hypothetical protein KP509_07G078900 [Ceratopteris richardii]
MCMCICICICICICMCVHAHIHTHACTQKCAHTHGASIHVRMFFCIIHAECVWGRETVMLLVDPDSRL